MESKRDIEAILDFVRQHQREEVDRLLLSAGKYPGVDMPAGSTLGTQAIEGEVADLADERSTFLSSSHRSGAML